MGEGEEVVELAELGRRVHWLVLVISTGTGGVNTGGGGGTWLLAPSLRLRRGLGCLGLGGGLERLRGAAGLRPNTRPRVTIPTASGRRHRRSSILRRRRAEGGGAGDDVEQAADVGYGELLRVVLCRERRRRVV